MRPDPVVEFCLGLGALLIAIIVALLLAFPPAWMDKRQSASAFFANVSGLGEGANVSENGFIQGNVTAIEPWGGGFRVHMKLRPQWHLKAGLGLTVEQTNPLQAGSLAVAHICKLVPGGSLPTGCCPDRLITGSAAAGEAALASCGRTPSLIDVAMATTVMVSTQLKTLSNTMPPLLESTKGAVAATTAGMTAMKAVSDKALVVFTDNGGTLKSTLANANTSLANVSNTTKTLDQLLTAKREQLDISITNLSNVMATTAVTMPGIAANLQKASEDLRAVSGQIRNEPTSVLRKRERADPSFVEPAAEK
jgi:ABC-type transporter Mla subunit MlaD